ncbi:MAG: hypothetical protein GOU97_04380 [Nanoarchaeota archaeon]|nr:hypothetical protein [Nanoarchaeota archaeon]
MERVSVMDWKKQWYSRGIELASNDETTNWYSKKRIEIISTPDVKEKIIAESKLGIESLINKIGLDIEIVHNDAPEQVLELIKKASFDEFISVDIGGMGKKRDSLFFEELLSSLQALDDPCAQFIITNRHLAKEPKKYYERTPGIACFGYAILGLGNTTYGESGYNPNRKKMSYLAMHETAHLLGFNTHHSLTPELKGFGRYFMEKLRKEECVLERTPHTSYACQKLQIALTSLWQGLQEQSGINFF